MERTTVKGTDTYQAWVKELEGNFEETVEMRRYLHQYPEPSFEEKETAQYILEKLRSFGIQDIQENVGNGYGIVAKIKGAHPGPTIAFRADFDALRIQEENKVSYKSKKEGVMHACGHDTHTATLLSVAQVLFNHREDLHGTVVLLHQNAEEVLPGGAKSMVEAGAMEDVDYVFGQHVQALLEAEKIGYTPGYAMAAADFFTISIQGKGGHGAYPHETIDSVIIATKIVEALQTLVSRTINPLHPAVVTVSTIQAGGEANNIIADTAMIKGTVRTYQEEARDTIQREMEVMANSVADMYHATCKVNYTRGYDSVYNHPEETSRFVSLMKEKFGEDNIVERDPTMGGEDFGYFSKVKPGVFFNVGGFNPDLEATFPHHHPRFNVDEKAMLVAGQTFLAIAEDYLVKEG
ncbi:amidohydrolase [Jeotgalibaca sp. MA1X17-3]|uniref:M20 metallopeptidase family protein n=1 Tax=Jeotgalibaca sp. MA1X17-3 TaxID=2908211 RepID=UPI001F431426|nr:amidohydrolase [Jeotgalibaca sp. MA1X17-3]UJF15576.1 amidohydrolase [Jeotgalibaca sp. MA1X17-3]